MKSAQTIDAEEQAIIRGKYREQYLIYNRKSTDDTDNQKNSIKYQKSENGRFALRQNLSIAHVTIEGFATEGIVSERHSGFKEDLNLVFGEGNTVQYRVERPKFHRLVQMLSRGCFKGVVFLCWDRASRNKGDDTVLRKLMKAGVDIRFTLAQYDKSSAGELHMDIDGMFAEHHSRVTREKVTITIRNARARGLLTNKAPVGYLNLGSMERKPLDPARAPIIRKLFELAATGEWALADLARWAIDQGFTMPPVRRRRTTDEMLAEEEDDIRLDIAPVSRLPTFTSIHQILTNPTYTGKTLNDQGQWIATASLEAIVPETLFDNVQRALHARNKSAHYVTLLDHPLRRLVRCVVCKRVYTPYIQKGVIYYGARCDRRCTNPLKSVNFEYISTQIGKLIRNLCLTENDLAELDARTSTDVALLDAGRIQRLEEMERRKKRLREELAYLNANRLQLLRAGVYTPEGLVAEDARLNTELASLKDAEDISDASMRETIRDVVVLSELLKEGVRYYDSANPHEKDQVIRAIFSELSLGDNTLQYKCSTGFAALQSRFVASSDPTAWLSELVYQHQDILSCIDLLNATLAADAPTTNVVKVPKRRKSDPDHDREERRTA